MPEKHENTTSPLKSRDDRAHKNMLAELGRNRELLESIYASNEKTKRYLYWIMISQVVKIVVIVVPLIIALFFLIPFLEQAVNIYTGAGLLEEGF